MTNHASTNPIEVFAKQVVFAAAKILDEDTYNQLMLMGVVGVAGELGEYNAAAANTLLAWVRDIREEEERNEPSSVRTAGSVDARD